MRLKQKDKVMYKSILQELTYHNSDISEILLRKHFFCVYYSILTQLYNNY